MSALEIAEAALITAAETLATYDGDLWSVESLEKCENALAVVQREIAAAPDLLAFAEAVEGLIAWALDNGAAPESTRVLETMRRAAVRKARGEA